jgi:hypothetical protein
VLWSAPLFNYRAGYVVFLVMDYKLNELQIAAILSADPSGQIVIPCGTGAEIEAYLAALLRLEKAGFVLRDAGTAFYRPFVLTPQGHSLKAELSKQPSLRRYSNQ